MTLGFLSWVTGGAFVSQTEAFSFGEGGSASVGRTVSSGSEMLLSLGCGTLEGVWVGESEAVARGQGWREKLGSNQVIKEWDSV